MTSQLFSQFSPRRIWNRGRFAQLDSQAVRRLSIESLETRELLTVGSLLQTLDNPAPAAIRAFRRLIGSRFSG